MDVNNARIVITQMQACFKELSVPFVSESEILNQASCTDTIKFRSWQSKNSHLAEILTYLFIEPNVIEISMNYYEDLNSLNEADMRELLNLMNAFNNRDAAYYWLLLPRDNKLKFRLAYLLSDGRFNEEQFKSVLRRFLEQGPRYYLYIRRTIDHNEDPQALFYEMQAAKKTV